MAFSVTTAGLRVLPLPKSKELCRFKVSSLTLWASDNLAYNQVESIYFLLIKNYCTKAFQSYEKSYAIAAVTACW